MKSLFIIFLLLLAVAGCEQEIPIAPASPRSIKMQLNHREIVTSSNVAFALWIPDKGSIHISGYFKNSAKPDIEDQFLIYLSAPIIGTNVIPGDEDYTNLVSYAMPLAPAMKQFYSANARLPVSGEVILTKFDFDKKLISGTFKVILATNDRTETLIISHGSFTDIQIIE